MVVDLHTHVFPDELARRVMPGLEEAAGVKAVLPATLGALRASMTRAGVDVSVVQHVATRPGQERTINHWAASIQDERVLCFGALHPDLPGWRGEIRRLVDLGLKGVKFHPDYQDFRVDAPRMFPLYEALCAAGLAVLFHAGIDIALPDPCHCRPAMLAKVIERFPAGRWVAAHMGGYKLWDEVEEHLLGRPLYLDTSYCLPALAPERMKCLIRAHGVERVLFGSDSPWAGQKEALEGIKSLGLTKEEEEAILGGNARRLLQGSA